jgi:AcrR family transcriptional regulator
MVDVHPVRPRRGRPPKGEAGPTRELLLDAALKLFAERGFVGTTVRQIARAVGVTDAAIYAHFQSKQALFDVLMAEAGPPLLDRLGVDLEALSQEHPAEVIPQTFQRLVHVWDQPRVRLFTSVLLRHTPERINEAIAVVHTRLTPVVQAWMTRGWVRDDVKAELLAWELLAPLALIRLSLLHSAADESDRDRAPEMARQHLDYFVKTNVMN